MYLAISGAILAAPVPCGHLACAYTDRPLASDGFSFEVVPGVGLLIRLGPNACIEPFHRVLHVLLEPGAVPAVDEPDPEVRPDVRAVPVPGPVGMAGGDDGSDKPAGDQPVKGPAKAPGRRQAARKP